MTRTIARCQPQVTTLSKRRQTSRGCVRRGTTVRPGLRDHSRYLTRKYRRKFCLWQRHLRVWCMLSLFRPPKESRTFKRGSDLGLATKYAIYFFAADEGPNCAGKFDADQGWRTYYPSVEHKPQFLAFHFKVFAFPPLTALTCTSASLQCAHKCRCRALHGITAPTKVVQAWMTARCACRAATAHQGPPSPWIACVGITA